MEFLISWVVPFAVGFVIAWVATDYMRFRFSNQALLLFEATQVSEKLEHIRQDMVSAHGHIYRKNWLLHPPVLHWDKFVARARSSEKLYTKLQVIRKQILELNFLAGGGPEVPDEI